MLLGRVASQMVSLVLVLLILERYGSPTLAGVATFLSLTPGLVVSPIAGTLLDRYGRRRLIVLDYLVAMLGLLLLAGLSLANALPVPLLLLIVAVQSLTFPLSTVGMRTLFPLVVPRPLWERANAIDSNGYAVSSILGPAAAGAVVAAFHGEGGLVAAALVFAAGAVVTASAPDVDVREVEHGPVLRAAWDGVVHVARHPTLRALAVGVSVGNLASGILVIAIPVIVLQRLHGSAALVGQLFAAEGVVAFISILLIGRISTEGRERWFMIAAVLLSAAAVLPLLARLELAFVILALLVRGVTAGLYDVPMFTLRQRRTDPAWLGRAFAVSMSLNFIGFPIGSAMGGVLAAASLELALVAIVVFSLAAAASLHALLPRS
ncbi:MAG: MFS transporter [Chloroflexi bacterium]|nr:MFS transporter [Chloroflexota bacterium]